MKMHKKYNHDLPGVGYWGNRGEVDLRVNFGKFDSGGKFPYDPLHYHETRTTYFCVIEGELQIEVSGEKFVVISNQMIEIEPNEIYRTIGVGDNGCSYVVIGSHNENDRIIVDEG